MERRYVHRVLGACGGNKTHAAKILGIDRRSLYRRLDDSPKDNSKDTSKEHSHPPKAVAEA